jgi:hypothetical protein
LKILYIILTTVCTVIFERKLAKYQVTKFSDFFKQVATWWLLVQAQGRLIFLVQALQEGNRDLKKRKAISQM